MKVGHFFLVVIVLLMVSCRSKTNKTPQADTASVNLPPPPGDIPYSKTAKVNYLADTLLSYKKPGISCDSVVAVDYLGVSGEHTFMPINDKGQWITTIYQKRKLDAAQIRVTQRILGGKKAFMNPSIIGCYEPRLGLIYFRKNIVIAQTAICMGCHRTNSTAMLGNGSYY